MFKAHVEEEFESEHHNGPPGHKCRKSHGHTWLGEAEFKYLAVDAETGWGPDFGVIKAPLKALDHDSLNEIFGGNPYNVSYLGRIITDRFAPSAENIAVWYWNVVAELTGMQEGKIYDLVVRIREGGGNWVEFDGIPYQR